MRFQLIGVNHNSAPVEVRERLAIPESRLPDTCRDLSAYPGIEEGMVISTCNRVEIVTHTTNGAANLRGFLHDHFQVTAEELDAHLYEFREKDAVRHIFRVASSLDSMVVGEAQILGQVKEAYATARAVGAVRGQLDQLFSRAFAVAKRAMDAAPKLVPIAGHRFIPEAPHEEGNPVFSVHQTDIIYYGRDLAEYAAVVAGGGQ